eukprot:1089232_1
MHVPLFALSVLLTNIVLVPSHSSNLDCNYVMNPEYCLHGMVSCMEFSYGAPIGVCHDHPVGNASQRYSCVSNQVRVSIWDDSDTCDDSVTPTKSGDVTSIDFNCNATETCDHASFTIYYADNATTCVDGDIPTNPIGKIDLAVLTDTCFPIASNNQSLSVSSCGYSLYNSIDCSGMAAIDLGMSASGTCGVVDNLNCFGVVDPDYDYSSWSMHREYWCVGIVCESRMCYRCTYLC